MTAQRLQRTYVLRGLDRVLYRSPPVWPEGTFIQSEDEVGELVLHADNMASPRELGPARAHLDLLARQFQLAIAKRIGCPLSLRLVRSQEPSFDEAGVASAHDTVAMSDRAESFVAPKDPPATIEQLPEAAARWIFTLTEARRFSTFQEEVFKRLYLLIEELKEDHASALSDAQRALLPELAWLRHFVSHPTCHKVALCEFIAAQLPSAVVSYSPWEVRFDRTNVEHRNFIGRYEPKARDVAGCLLEAAIAELL